MSTFIIGILFLVAAVVIWLIAPHFTEVTLSKRATGYLASALIAIAGLFFLFSLIVIVPSGQARVAQLLGVVQDGKVYTEGVHLTNPLYTFAAYNVRRQNLEYTGNSTLKQLTGDSVPLTLDLTIAWRLNPEHLDQFHRVIGGNYSGTMMHNQIRRATRDAVVLMQWSGDDAEERDRLGRRITDTLQRYLREDLVSSGFTEQQAASVFTIYDAQLRRIAPPERVIQAVSEKVAAQEHLERQETLLAIARKEAERRQTEGEGVANLFAELPDGYTAADIRTILDAISTKTRADAMQAAVETEQVSTLVMFGDAAQPPTVSVNGQ